MRRFIIFSLVTFLNTITSTCDYTKKDIEYYERLINEGIQNSSSYRFPKDATEYKPINSEPIDFGSYDFVVIGGGSAGSVVASRLSEIKQWKVLLLEAGKDGNNFTDIPSMSIYSLFSEYNWGFNSTRQKNCCLASGGICSFPRGKGLGGTSLINLLIYTRGNRLDYNRWEDLGNPGWSYKDVLPYFIKSEDSNINGDKGYHGLGGYLNIEYHTPISKRVDIFLEANREQGRCVLDYNGREQVGASRIQFNKINGRRLSSAKAFLDPIRYRTNLRILAESYVTKILISNATNRAYGVTFSHKNQQYFVKINMEVVLSAGVVGSPHILMLSGIGPKKHLHEVEIPLVKDLAVGRNLHDHLTFYSNFFLTSQEEPSLTLNEAIKQYFNGTGPLTISSSQGLSFYKLNLTDHGAPDVEIIIIPSLNSVTFNTTSTSTIHGHSYEPEWGKSFIQNHIFQILIVLLHPKTRGNIYLKSNNPYYYPIIDSRCLDDPKDEDIEGVYKGIQTVLDLVNTDAFRNITPILTPFPNCLHHGFLSKKYWICFIRQTATNAYHGGGTCKMGPDSTKGAVVNNRLQVHGIANIRVADNSIVPETLSAHMNAPAMMIGERAADFIKADYGG